MSIVVFPKDIWVYCIENYLSPVDISRLRSTCRTLRRYFLNHEVTNEFRKRVSSESVEFCMETAAFFGYEDLVRLFVSKGATNYDDAMISASSGLGKLHLFQYLASKGADIFDLCIYEIAMRGDQRLIDYFVEKGAKNWHMGMMGAIQSGNLSLVKYFVSKGANKWETGLKFAVNEGNLSIAKYFVSQGAKDFETGLEIASREGYEDLIHYFIKKGANDWNRALIKAARGGHLLLCKYFVEKGANSFNSSLREAVCGLNLKLIDCEKEDFYESVCRDTIPLFKFLISKGATNLKDCLSICEKKILRIVEKYLPY